MKKITISDLVKLHNDNNEKQISEDDMLFRINENSIEIAINFLGKMQDICEFGRDTLIRDFIVVWSKEAEVQWIQRNKDEDLSYYDFIDEFAENKFNEFKEEYGEY